MIRVTVDLLPGGDETLAKNLGVIEISNMSDLDAESLYFVDATDSWAHHYVSKKLVAHSRRDSWVRLLWKVLTQMQSEHPHFGKSHVA